MYKSWYAAHINQLTADEAAAFLSLLDTLDRDTAPDDVRAFALDEMRQKVELNLQMKMINQFLLEDLILVQ